MTFLAADASGLLENFYGHCPVTDIVNVLVFVYFSLFTKSDKEPAGV